jgi:hypothetical protein
MVESAPGSEMPQSDPFACCVMAITNLTFSTRHIDKSTNNLKANESSEVLSHIKPARKENAPRRKFITGIKSADGQSKRGMEC